MNKTLITILAVAALAVGGFYGYREWKIRQAPLTAPVAPRRLTPEGEFCLLERASVTSNSGIIGINPGTRVKLLEDKGDTMLVSTGENRFEVASDTLTNDLELAEMAARNDQASQQAIHGVLEQHRAADLAARRQEFIESENRKSAARAAAPPAPKARNPLDRPTASVRADTNVSSSTPSSTPRVRRPVVYDPRNDSGEGRTLKVR